MRGRGSLARFSKEGRQAVSDRNLAQLTCDQFNYYGDTVPPTPQQAEYARQFFQPSDHSPIHLWVSSVFREIPESDIPEVVMMGRSNVGKSSLINALIGKPMAYVSSKPGRTKEFHAYGVGGKKMRDSRFSLIDIPGYGKGSQTEWGREIIKYLEGRKQYVHSHIKLRISPTTRSTTNYYFHSRLRRVIVLIDPSHGLKRHDRDILAILRERAISHQIIGTKLDNMLVRGGLGKSRGFHRQRLDDLIQKRDRIRESIVSDIPSGPGALDDMLFCCVHPKEPLLKGMGVDHIQWAILRAAGLEPPAEALERIKVPTPKKVIPSPIHRYSVGPAPKLPGEKEASGKGFGWNRV